MLETMKINKNNMRESANKGFINATDCSDYLVKKGMPFRDAYKVTGTLVSYCIDNNLNINFYFSFTNLNFQLNS